MNHRFFGRCALSAALLAALVAASSRADACGGFFCSQAQPVNQAAERIIFADNGDGTVTAVIQILYQGPAESFSWLLPIGSVPEDDQIGVASDIAFQRLQFATDPLFSLNTRVEGRCRRESGNSPDAADDTPTVGGLGPVPQVPDGSVTLEASGVVGAFEYAVISVEPGAADPATPALEWLTANGYDIPPGGAALVGPYLADNMFLLALRLTKGSDSGSIRPLRITYAAAAPMIPIKLTAVAANQDMGVMAWVLSKQRAVPFNYNALELNEARINWFNPGINYNAVVTEAANEAGGQGFVTEFAGASSLLDDVVWSQSEEQQWQSVRSKTYRNLGAMFEELSANYQQFSGFQDAIRRTVTPPPGVSVEDVLLCSSCYEDELQFSPSALLDALESDVIEPMRSVQGLLERAPYTTRLYSTLSAAEMTVDPVFVFNPDLPAVDNNHVATRVIECNSGVTQDEASWRIELPQGTVVRGNSGDFGTWPSALAQQPPNLRVLTLADSGEGAVVADNTDTIVAMLDDFNSGIPVNRGDSGFCNIAAAGTVPRSAPLPLGASIGLLLGAAWWRRRAARHSRH
jgi:hypothetical protein